MSEVGLESWMGVVPRVWGTYIKDDELPDRGFASGANIGGIRRLQTIAQRGMSAS